MSLLVALKKTAIYCRKKKWKTVRVDWTGIRRPESESLGEWLMKEFTFLCISREKLYSMNSEKDLGRSTKQRDVKSFGIKVSFWARHCDRCCHETEHNLLHAKLKLQFHKTWKIVGTWGAKHEWSTGKQRGINEKGHCFQWWVGLVWKKKINSVTIQLQRVKYTHFWVKGNQADVTY